MALMVCITDIIGLDGYTIVLSEGKEYTTISMNDRDTYLVKNDLGVFYEYNKTYFQTTSEYRSFKIEDILK